MLASSGEHTIHGTRWPGNRSFRKALRRNFFHHPGMIESSRPGRIPLNFLIEFIIS